MSRKIQPITLNKLENYISQYTTSEWEEDPVSLEEFVVNPDYLGLEPFTEIQSHDLKIFVGDNPKEFWTSIINQCVMLLGKGSGKDTMASRLLTYACYLLLCLRNPQKYFKLQSTDWIDCINVAYSADQAKYVFFDKLKQCFIRCQWFKKRYKVVTNPKQFGELSAFPNEIQIGVDRIFLPRGIRCFSEHAQNESYEGYNIIFWVMDECSSFLSKTKRENANSIYKTLRTSANSRFPNKWKGMMLSYPREKDDFTCQKYEESFKNPNMIGFKHPTWVVNPILHPPEPSFEFNGMNIPMTLYNEFRDDPIDAMCKYGCEPSEDNIPVPFDAVERVIYQTPMLLDYYSESFTINGERKIGNFIQKWNYDASFFKDNSFVAHYDLGETGDCATLCIGHKETATVTLYKDRESGLVEVEAEKVIIDLIVRWSPDKKKNIKVSFLNAESFLEELINFGMRIVKLTYDQWNSGRSAEYFTAKGLNVEKHNIDSDDYAFMISLLNSELLWLPNLNIIKTEFKALRRENGRFDHSKQGSKDVLDGICGICRNLIGSKKAFGLQVISGFSGGASPNIRFNGGFNNRINPTINSNNGVGNVRRNDGGNNSGRPIDFENLDMPRPEDFGLPSALNKNQKSSTQRRVPMFLAGSKGSW